MKKIKAVIVDDEQHALDALDIQIARCNADVEVLAKFSNPEEAVRYLKNNEIDILFLDIEMPRMNGFQLLAQWNPPPFEVIFTTAYDQFAVEAFRVSAFDYLLKPVDRELLINVFTNFKKNQNKGISLEQLSLLRELINQKETPLIKIPLPVSEGLIFIGQQDIIRCEGDAGYTHIYINNAKPILLSKTLKDVEEQLFRGCGFIRVHQSHLINPLYLKKYIKSEGGYLIMTDGTHIPLSRRKKEDFLDLFR
ncbi:LytR/AlgR family response regulator transcription factor [Schleiferia thermophila]